MHIAGYRFPRRTLLGNLVNNGKPLLQVVTIVSFWRLVQTLRGYSHASNAYQEMENGARSKDKTRARRRRYWCERDRRSKRRVRVADGSARTPRAGRRFYLDARPTFRRGDRHR